LSNSLKIEKNEELLAIYFLDAKILDETSIKRLAAEVLDILEKTDQEKVLLDFQCVRFMSSAALGMLIKINKQCKKYNTQIKLVRVCPEIRKVFEITQLHKVFEIYDDPNEAIAAFAKKKGFFG